MEPEHPALKLILEETRGMLLYHEQIEEVMVELAGFSAAEAR